MLLRLNKYCVFVTDEHVNYNHCNKKIIIIEIAGIMCTVGSLDRYVGRYNRSSVDRHSTDTLYIDRESVDSRLRVG